MCLSLLEEVLPAGRKAHGIVQTFPREAVLVLEERSQCGGGARAEQQPL